MSRNAALLSAVAVTTTALAAGLAAPGAGALTLDAVTTGPLLKLADIAGVKTLEIPDVPVVGSITVNLNNAPIDVVGLADAINAYPFGGFVPGFATFSRQPGGALGTAILAGSGLGAFKSGLSYEALLSSAAGTTLPGYTPLVPSGRVSSVTGASCTTGLTCVQGTNVTNLAVLEVNNPGTPNGGLYSRFKQIRDRFDLPSVSIGGTSVSSTGIAMNSAVVGLGWGYNPLSDFPVTLNPFALTNTVMASLFPTNMLGGTTFQGASDTAIIAALAFLASSSTPSTLYSTVVPDDLAMLEPLRLPARVSNAILARLGSDYRFGNPLADALQPALSILVNTAYTDVQTPTAGGLYTRTFDQSDELVTFLSKKPLTPAEWKEVPGDVTRALVVGFQNSFPLLRFGKTAPVLTVDGNHLAITYPPAAIPAAAVAKAVAAPGPVAERAVDIQPVASAAAVETPSSPAVPVASPRKGGAAVNASVAPRAAQSRATLHGADRADRADRAADSATRKPAAAKSAGSR
jgi:hypothetical protein